MESLLADPSMFPLRLDFDSRRVLYGRTTRQTLDQAAFLDGRVPVCDDDRTYVVDLDEAMNFAPPVCTARLMIHLGFCGSTAMARNCSVPGHSLGLKEPQILVDLANWHATMPHAPDFATASAFVLAQLSRRFVPTEVVVIKPSNWVNSIVSTISANASHTIFIVIDERDYLGAVLSGGRPRLEFVGRLVAHFARTSQALDRLIPVALAGAQSLEIVLRLTILARWHQLNRFGAAFTANRIEFDDILVSPKASAVWALDRLGIDVPTSAVNLQIDRASSHHAKNDGELFSADAAKERRRNSMVEHAALIDAAIRWGDDVLGPDRGNAGND